ncbi:MAG: hypothetical protein QN141_03565 [Armatimonadota bacterium]|nr:hypothetical protein [Armatimonadota bacterium]MDR7451422.1 hypothetical protein [Armatimonadota bacterium]MDR7466428.1 hypothetical protein [Armatimonadota bacterium]MDR7493150.1 hypothetical protein [Armatimonadota bacterium]MDR7500339.1 hypothetical protein [Armatimonadota bacterium]
MTASGETSVPGFDDLFERARRALAERGSVPPTPDPAAPEGGAAGAAEIVAHLRVDEASQVWVRFCDARTGQIVAEVPSQRVAAAAARLQAAMR